MSESKIIPYELAQTYFEGLRSAGMRIVQCHGVFDLIHPGYVQLFETARAFGDRLVVTVPGESALQASGGQPYFNEQLRIMALAALTAVDNVVIAPGTSAAEVIRCIRPHTLCRAQHDSESEVLESEAGALRDVGGTLVCIDSPAFHSAKLINNFFNHLPKTVRTQGRNLAKQYPPETFRRIIEQFMGLRVLVVGDTIFDRYSYVKVQGLTSKNRIISSRFLKEHTDPGGALAVARHIRQFTPNVRMVSLIGQESWADPAVREHLSEREDHLVRHPSVTTVLKQRYVEPVSDEKEMTKLFSVNYIDSMPPPDDAVAKIVEKISSLIEETDLVVVADFGHGLMAPEVRELVQSRSPFLAINCQTNSYNHGFNIISHQYQRCDSFSLDEQELLLSCARRGVDYGRELETLRHQLGAKYAWLTRGGVETIGVDSLKNEMRWPPLEPAVTDTVGAGDAFFSVVALAAARGVPIELSTFLGQLAGGQAVKIIGNSEPISKHSLIESGISLLNF